MVERGRGAPKIENNGKEVKKLRSNRKGRRESPANSELSAQAE